MPPTRPGRASAVRRLALAAILWLLALRLLAQATGMTTGDLAVAVRDESGAPLSGAAVTVALPGSALSRSGTTAADGRLTLRLLPPGTYTATASFAGLRSARVEAVVVGIGATASVELVLRVEAVAASVTVEASPSGVDLTAPELSSTLTEREIRALPINRRNFLEFALTTPGVTADRGPQTGAAVTSGLSFNGQDPRANNVLLDGLDDNDAAVGAVRSALTQEAVLEYQVIRSPYSPEYGRAGGGVVNAVTRSGSNALAGTAFVFYRDQALSGTNALTGEKTPYQQWQFGAALSGPILRDRLFFFAAAERLDVDDANDVRIDRGVADAIEAAGFPIETGIVPFSRGGTSVFARLDASPLSSQSWALRGTWASENDQNQQPWGGLVAESAGGVRDIEDGSAALMGVSLFGADASNELRVLYADRSQRLDPLDTAADPSVEILGVATFGTQSFLPQPRDSQTWEVFDAVSFLTQAATVKVGVDYVHTAVQGSLPLYFLGQYQFLSVDHFQAGQPVVFVQGFGDPYREVSASLFSAFAQAEWTPSPRFLLRGGVRYDLERPAAPFPADTNNWAPRLSFSWAPAEAWRVRGGLGRFYAAAPVAPMFLVGAFDGVSGRILLRTFQEDTFDSMAEAWSRPSHRYASESEAGAYAPAVFREGEFRSAHTDLATAGVETRFARNWAASLDYVYARGLAILVERNVNPIAPALEGRPDPAYRDIRRYESTGNTWYDGITLALQTGLGGPLQLAASYTWARAESDYIDFSVGQPQDPLDPNGERGPTIHVPKQRATLSCVYATPRAGSWWARDWTFSMISDVSIGRPYNELAGYDRNGNGDPSSDRPEGVGHNESTLPAWWNADLRIARRIPVAPLELELTVEAFNVFGRANVLEVNNVRFLGDSSVPNPDFGAVTRVADPTRLQFGLRVRF